MIKHATRKPERRETNARNKKPTKPNTIEMYDCTQNELSDVHVSLLLRSRARAVPAVFADSTRNEKPCIHIKTTLKNQRHTPPLCWPPDQLKWAHNWLQTVRLRISKFLETFESNELAAQPVAH